MWSFSKRQTQNDKVQKEKTHNLLDQLDYRGKNEFQLQASWGSLLSPISNQAFPTTGSSYDILLLS